MFVSVVIVFCTACGQWNCDGQLEIQVSGTQRCPFHGSPVNTTKKAVVFPWFNVLLISQKTGKGKRSEVDGGFAPRMMAYAGWDIWLDVGWVWTIFSCYRLTGSSETWLWDLWRWKDFHAIIAAPLTSCLVRGIHLAESR